MFEDQIKEPPQTPNESPQGQGGPLDEPPPAEDTSVSPEPPPPVEGTPTPVPPAAPESSPTEATPSPSEGPAEEPSTSPVPGEPSSPSTPGPSELPVPQEPPASEPPPEPPPVYPEQREGPEEEEIPTYSPPPSVVVSPPSAEENGEAAFGPTPPSGGESTLSPYETPEKKIHWGKIFLVGFLLLALVGGGASAYFFKDKILEVLGNFGISLGGKGGEAPPPGPTPPPGPSAGECVGETYENTRQGYKVCMPPGWEATPIGYSDQTVIFSSDEVPLDSEIPANDIAVRVSRKDINSELSDSLSSFDTPAQKSVSVDEVSATQVAGEFPEESLFAGFAGVDTLVSNFSRIYVVFVHYDPLDEESFRPIYDEFVSSLEFIPATPNPPWSDSIWVDLPWPGDEISPPLKISGEAQGFFENTLVAVLKDEGGNELFKEPLTYTSPDVGELGFFDETFTFTSPAAGTSGTLELYGESAQDGSPIGKVTIPVQFK